MYFKTRIPRYLIVTRPIEPPIDTYPYDTWVFPLARQEYEEPTIIRYRDEDAAVEGHVLAVERFLVDDLSRD
jgi:hypothetical protein